MPGCTPLPLVSVVIPTYNRARLVCEAVETVLAQTYRNFEIIVVDDGSTDETEEALGRYEGRIKYFYQENRGLSAARNTGIRNSTGCYIALLDSDDLWRQDKLALQVDYLNKHDDCGLVYTDMELLIAREGVLIEVPTTPLVLPTGYIYPQVFLRNEIFPSTVLVRKECLEDVGLFDESLRHFEDYELWLRIARRYKIGNIDKKLTVYRRHVDNLHEGPRVLGLKHTRMLQRHVRDHPEIIKMLGKRKTGMRISEPLFAYAYGLFDEGDFKNARRYMRELIALNPTRWAAYLYFLASLLPLGVVQSLRKLKRSLNKA